jgi:hypothetical protein
MPRRAATAALAVVFAAAAGGERARAQDEASVNPFEKTYLTLELARNFPVSFTQNRFDPGRYSPVLGYRHDLDEHWLMGIGGQFKVLKRRDSEVETPTDRIALLTVYHETLYAIRLDHPTYLLLGPKLMYLLPANAGKLPVQRADEYQTEIGAALSMTFAHVVDDKYMVTLRVDRWRGTKTMKFHGVEVAGGISWALR